jgi:hypothetical protein
MRGNLPSLGLMRLSQFARKPAHRVRFHRVSYQQPCFSMLKIEALEGPLFKAVRGVLDADGHHARLTLGTARALDRQQLRIGLSHVELVDHAESFDGNSRPVILSVRFPT